MTDDSKTKAEEIKRLYQQLLLCQGDLRTIQTTCDRLLILQPGDSRVMKYKAVALIDASHFDTALKVLQAAEKTPCAWPFGVAYCFYRQERYEEALQVLRELTNPTYEELVLRAQCLYRQEKFAAAAKEYADIVKAAQTEGRSEEEMDELVVNYTAALIESGQPLEAQQFSKAYRNDRGSQDLTLNAALSAVLTGNVKDGLRMVFTMATSVSDVLKSEDSKPVSGDLAGLCALVGSASAMLGDNTSATDYLGTLVRRKTASTATTAVCLNNWVALQGVSDVFDSLHKMKQVLSKQVEAKLSANQRMITKYNSTILLICMGKPSQALSQANALFKDFPTSELAALALSCALSASGNRAKAMEVLTNFPSPSPKVLLNLAQLTLDHTQDLDAVLAVLQKMGPDRLYQGNVVSAFTRNAISRGKGELAIAFLQKATGYWKKAIGTPLVALLGLQAKLQTERKLYHEAVATFKTLLEHSPENEAALAGYVHALSNVNVEEALTMADRLPKYHRGSTSSSAQADLTALEAEELPKRAQKVTEKRSQEDTTQEKSAAKRRKKNEKKKKKRLANYGPTTTNTGAAPPDPERWLPIRERQSMKRLGKKAMAKMAHDRREAAAKQREAHKRKLLGLPLVDEEGAEQQ